MAFVNLVNFAPAASAVLLRNLIWQEMNTNRATAASQPNVLIALQADIRQR